MEDPGTENPGGGWVQIKMSSVVGYRCFLEPHILFVMNSKMVTD